MQIWAEDDQEGRKKVIVRVIIMVIAILSLVTSCSIASTFFGRIGNEFGNEGDFSLKDSEYKTIRNYDLRFEKRHLEISLSDAKAKLRFIEKKINPKKFTCVTSDAEKATCYVVNDHVVINPKKKGRVNIFLETKLNHTIYQATAIVDIGDPNKYIELSSYDGTINLAQTNQMIVGYNLVGLSGDIVAVSSNEDIAEVYVENGYLKIIAYKTGNVEIKVTITNNGITYDAIYNLNVINTSSSNRKNNYNNNKNHGHGGTTGNDSSGGNNNYVSVSSDNYLKDIKVSKGNLSPAFNRYGYYYTVRVDAKTKKITLKGIPNNSKAKVTYNGKKVSSLKDLSLKYGDNTVVIKVTAENGSTRDYVVNIYREYPKDSNNYLKDLKVTVNDKNVPLTPKFNKDEKNYKVVVPYDVDKATVTGILGSSKAEITYNGKKVSSLKDLNLNYGDNTVIVKVIAEDGSTRDYVVNIYRESKYTIKFDKDSYSFDLYTENLECAIPYKVYKNGVETIEYELCDVSAELTKSLKDIAEIELPEKGVVILKPDIYKIGDSNSKSGKLMLEYKDEMVIADITFKTTVPILESASDKYEMSISKDESGKVTGTTDIILNTNLFTGEVTKTVSEDKKEITICSKRHSDTCITISTDSSYIDSLDYIDNEDGPTYLPITITGKEEGNALLKVTGKIYGNEFKNIEIPVKIVRKYVVKVSANGGTFELGDTLFESKISKDEFIDLSDYGEPYKVDSEDECKVYKFIGYSTRVDGKIIYNLTDKNIVKDLDDDMNLYAIYETKSVEQSKNPEKRTIWLEADGSDGSLPIFHNEKYYKLHKEDKVIYPGATGYYVMNFKNDTSSRIVIKGMNLVEDTICIDSNGCLNMGYIIKYIPPQTSKNTIYYYGKENDYKVLNHDIDPRSSNYKGKIISFKDQNEEITLAPKQEVSMSILWKWVEIDEKSDELDTMIGNQAAESKFDETINDKYKISVGLNIEIYNDKCLS